MNFVENNKSFLIHVSTMPLRNLFDVFPSENILPSAFMTKYSNLFATKSPKVDKFKWLHQNQLKITTLANCFDKGKYLSVTFLYFQDFVKRRTIWLFWKK